jgi:hypothetical protein
MQIHLRVKWEKIICSLILSSIQRRQDLSSVKPQQREDDGTSVRHITVFKIPISSLFYKKNNFITFVYFLIEVK